MKKNTTPKTAAAKKTAAKKPAAKKPATKKPAVKKKAAVRDMQMEQVNCIRAALDSKKGENIAVLRVANVSSVTDYMVLCTGLNPPHLRALADEVAKQLRLQTPPVAAHRRAGNTESGWIVLDYLDIIVHLFTTQMRGYYALEQLWKDAPTVL